MDLAQNYAGYPFLLIRDLLSGLFDSLGMLLTNTLSYDFTAFEHVVKEKLERSRIWIPVAVEFYFLIF